MTKEELLKVTMENVKKYDKNPDENLVKALVNTYFLVMNKADSASVACSDDSELETVKKNFLIKKLGMKDGDDLDGYIKDVCEKMKGDRRKSRVVFYYLLVKATGKESVFV